jgi:hypothetical protein
MAKTKKVTGYPGNRNVPLIIVGCVAVLVGVIMGVAIDNWLDSAYDIGESEGYQSAALSELTNKESAQAIPAATSQKPAVIPAKSSNANLNTNSNVKTPTVAKTGAQSDTESLFEAAINQKNAAGMKELMARKVYYIEEATECCGSINGVEAVDEFLRYSKGTAMFNFEENQQIVKQMRVNLADFFSQEKYSRIGFGNDKKVIAYNVNSQNKVDKLYIVISQDLLDLE